MTQSSLFGRGIPIIPLPCVEKTFSCPFIRESISRPSVQLTPHPPRGVPTSVRWTLWASQLPVAAVCSTPKCSSQTCLETPLYSSPRAAVTQFHRGGGSRNGVHRPPRSRHGRGGVLPRPLSSCEDGRAPPVSSQGRPSVRICVLVSSSYKDPGHTGSGSPR